MKSKIITGIFIIYLLFFSMGSIIKKDREFSDMENRTLDQFPKADTEKILSGEYGANFEKYMCDQLIMKDDLVKLKVTSNRALNQDKINGVYFSSDDMLIPDYVNSYNQIDKNIEYIKDFAKSNRDIKCTAFFIPNTCHVYSDKLPKRANVYNQKDVLDHIYEKFDGSIAVTDCEKQLMDSKSENIFYKTDHHWTMDGAYIGYKAVCDKLGIIANEKSAYERNVVSEEFLGTQYSNAPTFNQSKDSIVRYKMPGGEYEVYYSDNDIYTNSLYNEAALNEKDKYKYYLDGNHSYVEIKSNAISGDNGSIIIVKDSYGHSLIPLLADHYSEIYVVDLRYYHSSVSELAKEKNVDNILFMYNLSFFASDDDILWLQ